MIEISDEMKAAFRAAQEQRASELVAEGAPLGAHDILDRGLAAVLAIVERNHCLRPPGHSSYVPLTCSETLETKGTVVRCGKRPNHLDNAHLARHDGWDVVW